MTKPLLCDVLVAIANFVNIMNREVLSLHATDKGVELTLSASGGLAGPLDPIFVIKLDLVADTGSSILWDYDHHGILEETDNVVTGTVRETWAGFAGEANEWAIG